ncbi:MAG TPA: magnesium chelatase domain-containing protein [Terriglobia bacterium]|nr:magnesium chelatase domain-containing protein [Terriglobia bacterium]
MLAKVHSVALLGLDAHLIDVEVDIAGGLPQFSVVGLPDATVRESRDRVRSALKNTGFHFPAKKITVNLAPADIKKEGTGLDLAIAIGILVAEEVISQDSLDRRVLVGELSLDGQIKPIPGALSIGLACRRVYSLLLPAENSREAAMVDGVTAYCLHTLPELWRSFEANASSSRCKQIVPASFQHDHRKKTTMAMSEDRITPSVRWRSPQPAGTMS